MGTQLYLVVPEEEQTLETIQQYYSYILQRKKELEPDSDWPILENEPNYRVGKRQFEELGEFYIASQITSDITEDFRHVGEQDPDQIYRFFKQKGDEELIIHGDTITELHDLFEQLKHIETPTKPASRELKIETQYLALCEFAKEHDYGIGLSI